VCPEGYGPRSEEVEVCVGHKTLKLIRMPKLAAEMTTTHWHKSITCNKETYPDGVA
jgi:hypothetical protein